MGDRWIGSGSTKSQYVFLPILMTSDGKMQLKWYDEWNLGMFTPLIVDTKKPSGIRAMVFRNAINNGSFHGYNLLGRSIPYTLQDCSNKAAMHINLRKKINGLAQGMLYVP
jgi:hypothetical protein